MQSNKILLFFFGMWSAFLIQGADFSHADVVDFEDSLPARWLEAADISSSVVTGYRLESLGQPIGFALAGQSIGHLPGPEKTHIYVLDRVGVTPAYHQLNFDLNTSEEGVTRIRGQHRFYIEDQIVSENHYEWLVTGHEIIVVRGQPTRMIPLTENPGVKPAEGPRASRVSLIFFKPKSGENQAQDWLFFNPFLNQLEHASETLFSEDGFADSVQMTLMGRLPTSFIRSERNELTEAVQKITKRPISLDALTPASEMKKDLARLERTVLNCHEKSRNFQERAVKKLPHVPYLLHRKTVVVRDLCKGAERVLRTFRDTSDNAKRQQVFETAIRNRLMHHQLEIPRSMAHAPEWPALFDDEKHMLWINSLRRVVELGLAELRDTFLFESERKQATKLRVVAKGRSLGTVLKAIIKSRALKLTTTVNESSSAEMLGSSWREVPSQVKVVNQQIQEIEKKKGKKRNKKKKKQSEQENVVTPEQLRAQLPPFQLFNGRTFLVLKADDLGTVCSLYDGQVGLDLGNAPHTLMTHSEMTGTWDSGSRLRLMELFLRKASNQRNCHDLIVRVPKALKEDADETAATFESAVVQANQELQLKNAKFRHLRLMPGEYDVFVHSLVSGKLIATEEFKVEEQKKTQRVTLRLEAGAL